MPNLRLTHEPPGRTPEHISWRNLVTAVSYFEQAALEELPVVDGEPTAHPQLVSIYRYLLARGFAVRLSVGDGLDDPTVHGLRSALEPGRSHFVLTVDEPARATAGQRERADGFLRALGPATSLRFCLTQPAADLGFLLDLVDTHRLRRRIRLDLAHPVAGTPPTGLPPDHYPALAARVGAFAEQCDPANVSLALGCGFTLCDFTDAQLGALARSGARLAFRCEPHLDILPDLSTRACFALPELAPQPLEEHPGLAALAQRYRALVAADMARRGFWGVHVQCDGCHHLARGQCGGGCRAYALGETR